MKKTLEIMEEVAIALEENSAVRILTEERTSDCRVLRRNIEALLTVMDKPITLNLIVVFNQCHSSIIKLMLNKDAVIPVIAKD